MNAARDGLDFIGPIEYHAVVLRGRRVPYLTATPLPGGKIDLSLDNRFAVTLTVFDAQTVIPFIADCIAVAMGYSGFPDEGLEPMPAQAMPLMMQLGSGD